MAFGDVLGTLTGNNSSPGTGISASGSVSVSVGDLIFVNYGQRQVPTNHRCTGDNLGNKYAALRPNATVNNQARNYCYYSIVTVAGTLTTVSVSHDSSTGDAGIAVAVFAGPFLPLIDVMPDETTDSASPLTGPATGTLSYASSVVIGALCQANAFATGNLSSSGGFTFDILATTGAGANTCCAAICHQVVSSTASVSPEFAASANVVTSTLCTFAFAQDTGQTVAFGERVGSWCLAAASALASHTMGGAGFCKANDLVVVYVGEQTANTVSSVTDDQSNSYSAVSAGTDAGNATARMFYCLVPSDQTIGNITITFTASTDNVAACAVAYRGPFAASPLDVHPADVSNDLTSPYTSALSGTLAQAIELVVVGLEHNGSAGATLYAVSAPLVKDHESDDGQGIAGVVMGSVVTSATTSTSYSFTSSSAPTSDVITLASFKQGTTSTTITPGAGSLSLSAQTPSVNTITVLNAGAATLSLTSAAPTSQQSLLLMPSSGVLALSSNTPAVSTITVLQPASASIDGFSTAPAPVVVQQFNILPSVATLSLTGAAPTRQQTTMLTGLAGTLSLSANTPVLQQQFVIQPAVATLALAANAPQVQQQFVLTPTVATLSLAGNTPVLTQRFLSQPAANALTLAGNAPQVTAAGSITAASATLSLASNASQVNLTINIQAAATSLSLASNAPTVAQNIALQPAAATLVLLPNAPRAAVAILLQPSTAVLALSAATPQVGAQTALQPAEVDLALTASTPTVAQDIALVPNSAQMLLTPQFPTAGMSGAIQSASLSLSADPPLLLINPIFTANLGLVGSVPLRFISTADAQGRVYAVLEDTRAFDVAAENRSFAVAAENRTGQVSAENRIGVVAPEQRVFDAQPEKRLAEAA